MADGKVIIETDLDSSGIEKGISGLGEKFGKVGALASKGLKVATTAIAGTATALGGVGIAAIKTGADFEAQMSRVQAISGATGNEFNQLKDLAIQLGADTSFSAKQAAEGMENLASAGFETNEIMDAMPGMLNLAAASGEDLATSADIAASTLNAFGMEAGEAAHVADVLAENANKTNSSVADTGEAMKYIAPLAHAAGISFEETAAAIGIMADAGIQGSQAGTTLRGALSRLSKPTGDMKEAMKELGISFYDSEGKMKSLSEQVGMLKKATAGMTDEQRNNYLVTLYGQEALSGMLALMDAGEDELASLAKSYEECDGAAEKAAETMQDNLNGALEELGGSAETLGILFYESVAGNLKKTVKSVTKSVNQISNAFKKGGIDAAVKQAGKEIANLATEAAKGAPKMIDAAVEFIKSFVQGISQNKGELITAAGEIAQAFADGLISLLPPKMQEPVRQAVDAISQSLTDGGLSSAIDTAGNLFSGMLDVISELAEVALPLLTSAIDFVGENLDELVPFLAAAAAGYIAYKTAVTAVETATTLAATAQKAWNLAMNLSPVGLLVGSVAALATGLGIAAIAQGDFKDATAEANGKLADQAKKIRDMQQARADAVADIESEYGYYQQLWDELQGIVNQNGKIKKGYEERAAFITSTLSSALGTEISITDGVIDKYGELKTSIDQLIQKQKQEAILSAYKDSYTEAIKKQAEAQSELVRTYNDYQAAQEEVNRLEEEHTRLVKEASAGNQEAATNLQTLEMQQEAANEALKEAESAYNNARTATDEYTTTIANYEAAMGAVEAGTGNAEAAIVALTNGLIRATGENEAELSKQVETYQAKYKEMEAAAEAGNTGVTQTMVDGAHAMWLMAQIEHENGTTQNKEKIAQYEQELAEIFNTSPAPAAAEAAAKRTGERANAGTESVDTKTPAKNKAAEAGAGWEEGAATAEPTAEAAGASISEAGAQGVESVDVATPSGEKGSEAGQNLASAAEAEKANVEAAGKELVNAILNGMSQSNAQELMKGLGRDIALGLSAGITEHQADVTNAINTLVESARSALTSANLSNTSKEEGTKAATEMQNAIATGEPGVISAIQALCDKAKTTLTSARIFDTAKKEGKKATTEMKNAVTSGTPGVTNAFKALCDKSKKELTGAKINQTAKEEGKKAVTDMKNAVTEGTPGAVNAVKSLCDKAKKELTGAKLPDAFKKEATNAAKNFKTAIETGTPSAVAVAKALGTKSHDGLKGVNLASKGKTEGNNLVKGFTTGINSGRGTAEACGASLGRTALNGLRSADLYSQGYSIGANLCAGIAAGISANASAAAAAAASAAASAAAAARANLQIHSPSRVGMEIGKMFDAGIAGGIESNTGMIEEAARSLADRIRKSVDMSAVTQGIRRSLNISTDHATAKMTRDARIRRGTDQNSSVDQSIHMVNNYNIPVASPSEVARTQREAARKLLGGVR